MYQQYKTVLYPKLHAFFHISRGNLLLASIGHATLGMLLAAGTLSNLVRIETGLYILLHYIIALFGCNINSLSDYEVDKLYKRYMADSVDIIGKSAIKYIIILEGIIAITLIIVFILFGYFLVALLAVIGFLGAFFYSAEPVRIKKHGLISPIPVLILYTFPLFGGWFLFRSELTWYFILFVVGYMLLNEGFTLVNTSEDYTEDKKRNIKTWAHLFGLKKTLIISFWFSLAGLLCVIAMGLLVLDQDSLIKIISSLSIIGSAVLIIKASFEVREVYRGEDLERRAKLYGVRLQRWFMMTRYPLMISAFLLLL